MSSDHRTLSFSLAINEAISQMMKADDTVFILGQGVNSPWYVGDTATGLFERFGVDRVIDTPVSENAVTGASVGAAIAGMRPIVVHPRMDFMLYAFDPIINQAANWHYMSGGNSSVPLVIWGIVNRGGEQAAQHSQTLHALFAHIPGLKVVMPSTPYDAKGLMVAAIRDDNPVVFIDDRWLYKLTGNVPEEMYEVPIGKGIVRRRGNDVTIVTISYSVQISIEAAEILESNGIDVEIIDLRTVKPLDAELVVESVNKTGRAVVVDGGWKSFGVSAEIAALIYEQCFDGLYAPVGRIALPDVPAPSSGPLEESYYFGKDDIAEKVKAVVHS